MLLLALKCKILTLITVSLILNICLTLTSLAEKPNNMTTEERIEMLEKKLQGVIEELESIKSTVPKKEIDRLGEIEKKLDILAEEIESIKMAPLTQEPRLEEAHGHAPGASKVYKIGRGVSIGGYGEIFGQIIEDNDNIADAQRVILYAGYKFTDRIFFNSEIEFEHGTTSSNLDGKSGSVSMEFANIDFLLSSYLNFRFGLNLVPMGIINEIHEPTTFHGVLRPDVEREIIPTTWREIGVGIFGQLVEGLTYRAYVLNSLDSRGFKPANIRSARGQGNRTRFNDIAFATRVEYDPIPEFNIGTSLYIGNTGQNEKVDGKTIDGTFTMLEIDYRFQWKRFASRALFVYTWLKDAGLININNGFEDPDSVGKQMYGFYIEGAYNFLPHLFDTNHYLASFVRYEQYNTQFKIPAGFMRNPANDRKTLTYGISYKPIPKIVLKLDYQDRRNDDDSADDQFNMGIGWVF